MTVALKAKTTRRGHFRSGWCNDQTDLRRWGHRRCGGNVPNGNRPPVTCHCRCHHRRRTAA